MSSTVASTTFSTFAQSAAAFAVPRNMTRSSMPFTAPTLSSESDNGYDAVDGPLRLVVDRSVTGKDGAKKLREAFRKSHGKSESDEEAAHVHEGKPAKAEEADAEEAEAEEEDTQQEGGGETEGTQKSSSPCDVVFWLPTGGEDAFSMAEMIDDDTLAIVVCSDDATETSIMDLLASLTRAVVVPFSSHASRSEWKKARHPQVQVASEWTPSEGDFDVPIARRLATLLAGTNRRLDAMYATVFSRKILTSGRAALSRWGKKCSVPVAQPERSGSKGAKEEESQASHA